MALYCERQTHIDAGAFGASFKAVLDVLQSGPGPYQFLPLALEAQYMVSSAGSAQQIEHQRLDPAGRHALDDVADFRFICRVAEHTITWFAALCLRWSKFFSQDTRCSAVQSRRNVNAVRAAS